jgi:hydroxyethylthiazole kinase-like sugar kinase family protein
MASDMQSALAAALEVVLPGIGISTLDDLASRVVDHGDEIAAYITSSGCRRAGLVAAQERERAAQAVAAANSAAAAALQAATAACSRAELEARLLRDELAVVLMVLWLLASSVRQPKKPRRLQPLRACKL